MKTCDKKFKCLEHVLHEHLVYAHIRLFMAFRSIGCRIRENTNNNSKGLVLKIVLKEKRRWKTIVWKSNQNYIYILILGVLICKDRL